VLRARKAEVLASLQQRYLAQKAHWDGYTGYDWWFARPLNNAHFASIAIYADWQPALTAMLRQLGDDMPAFHAACRTLGRLPVADRERYLDRFAGGSPPAAAPPGFAASPHRSPILRNGCFSASLAA
jgi:predicted aminopeptidase